MAGTDDESDLNVGDGFDFESESTVKVNCPVCQSDVSPECINIHLDHCLRSRDSSQSRAGNGSQEPVATPRSSYFSSVMKRPSVEHEVSRKSTKASSKDSPSSVKKNGTLTNFLTSPKSVSSKAGTSSGRKSTSPSIRHSVFNIEDDDVRPLPVPKRNANPTAFSPLADQMRPTSLAEYAGQEKILGPKSILRKLLESHDIPSMVLWGPPGCGKTSLAHVIATQCKQRKGSRFVKLSATTSGVKDVKDAVDMARTEQTMFKRKTILFIDEIHRFNKLQQDTFLPHVENGTITLIGATTENPSFSLNSALLSRCRVFVLEKLSNQDMETILRKALDKCQVSVCPDNMNIPEIVDTKGGLTESALSFLCEFCDGDARTALNALQMALGSKEDKSNENTVEQEPFILSIDDIKESLQRTHILYDRKGDQHYDIISAYIKSMRGSDVDAALYWLARMLAGGEDPRFIARRLVVFASEDVGLADPNALNLAASTYFSCQNVGMPECKLNLSHCTVYMARAGKSRACYDAFALAEKSVQEHQGPLPPVPLHLRNAPTRLMKDLGYGRGYKMYAQKDKDLSYLPPGVGKFFKEY